MKSTTTNAFRILKGVRQGDPVSPNLFTATLEDIFRNLDWQSMGIVVDGEHLTHLRFADDILLLSHKPHELQTMIRELSDESRKAGLNMNIKKTKVMMSNRLQDYTITVRKDYRKGKQVHILGKKDLPGKSNSRGSK